MIMPGTEDSIVLKRVMMDILKLKNGMEDTLTLLEQLSRRSEEKEESWSKVEVGRLYLITPPPLLNNDFMGVVNVLYFYLLGILDDLSPGFLVHTLTH